MSQAEVGRLSSKIDPRGAIPADRYKMVCLILIVHGIGISLPWNMFITSEDFYSKYKFGRNYTKLNHSIHAENFLQYLGFSFHVPNIVFIWLNTFVQMGGSITPRIVWILTTKLIIFLGTVVLAMVDSRHWPTTFFWVTMLSAIVLSMVTGLYEATLFGLAAVFPPKYSGYILLGKNLCGTLTAVIMMITLSFARTIKLAAVYYFIGPILILLICMDTYFVLPLIKFYKHYSLKMESVVHPYGCLLVEGLPYGHIARAVLPQLYNVFFIHFVTYAIYPAVYANIYRYDKNFIISVRYFSTIVCFFTFNFVSLLGSFLPNRLTWPKPKYIWIPVTLRVFYIPFYWYCNYKILGQKRKLDVIFNDWQLWAVSVTMAFSHGYFGTLAVIYAPATVEQKHASIAAMFAATSLITGTFMGVSSTILWPQLIKP